MKKTVAVIGFLFLCFFGAEGQSLVDEGIVLYEQGRYEEAAEKLNLATAADKGNNAAWLYLGASLHKVGKAREAAGPLKKVPAEKKIVVNGLDREFEVISKPRPRYTDLARNNSTSGQTRLVVEFLADGKIGPIIVVDALPDGLTEQSIAAARNIKFKPAVRNGQPVVSVRVIRYSFRVY